MDGGGGGAGGVETWDREQVGGGGREGLVALGLGGGVDRIPPFIGKWSGILTLLDPPTVFIPTPPQWLEGHPTPQTSISQRFDALCNEQ